MRNRLLSVSWALLLGSLGSASAQSLKSDAQREAEQLERRFQTVYEKAAQRTVLVRTLDDQYEVLATGSGAVVDEAGYVLTCAHVVEPGPRHQVVFTGGEVAPATLCDVLSSGDFALLKVESSRRMEAFRLGDSSRVEVGEWVVALGHPLKPNDDTQPALTVGRVQQVGGHLMADARRRYPNVIVTDAPIFSGNSGGPLCNLSGELIGLNAAIRTDRLESFSIAIDEIVGENRENLMLMKQGRLPKDDESFVHRGYSLIERYFRNFLEGDPADPRDGALGWMKRLFGGRTERMTPDDLLRENLPEPPAPGIDRRGEGFLGLKVRMLTADERQQRKLDDDRGLLVAEVVPNGPAAEAGVHQGDALVAIWSVIEGPDTEVATGTVEDLLGFLSQRRPGDAVGLRLVRDRRQRDLRLLLARKPDAIPE